MLTWLEISKSALVNNLKQFRKIIGKKIKLMAVVKSNAYGHGMIECAKIFEKNGADYLGVANLNEAIELRKNGLKKPILILTYWNLYDSEAQIKAIIKNIEFVVYTYPQVKILSKISQKIGKWVNVHIKVDTGTSRIGVLPQDALNFALKCLKLPNLKVRGIFTHFAKSEAKNQAFTHQQIEKLLKIKKSLTKIPHFPQDILFHAGCTASTINNKASFFDMVRIGIGLYGLWPSLATKNYGALKSIILKPALTWKTKIIQVKELPKGTPIGYDCTYRLKNRGKIAILPVGYWDGYDRKLSNCGEVLIRGKRAPVRGRICMNLMMVEVTKIPKVKVNDEVVLIGQQDKEKITAEEIALKIGTINYEVITRINPQIPRIYK
jgi:alanine racemase